MSVFTSSVSQSYIHCTIGCVCMYCMYIATYACLGRTYSMNIHIHADTHTHSHTYSNKPTFIYTQYHVSVQWHISYHYKRVIASQENPSIPKLQS